MVPLTWLVYFLASCKLAQSPLLQLLQSEDQAAEIKADDGCSGLLSR